jgi:Flp pilus assembly protein TadD
LFVVLAVLAGSGTLGAAEASAPNDDLDQRIARLIEELGDNQFAVRQRAQRELTRLGHAAFDALTAAENNDDVEIAIQARYLVRLIRIDWIQDGDSSQAKQLLSNYDARNESERLARMKDLAGLSGDTGIGPLCRLSRFEASAKLSKQAAAYVLKAELPADSDWLRRAKIILQNVDRSKRPAAEWLRTYVQAHDDPEAALAAWRQLADAERKTLEEHPQQTENQLVQELLRQQVDVLDRLKRRDEELAVIRKIVDLERGDPQTLTELVEWLAKREAWSVIDEVANRFSISFNGDAGLLYTLAQARKAQGNDALAEETAQRALSLNADKVREHINLAIELQKRGLIVWADREYRFVIGMGLGPGFAEEGLYARFRLSENLHDRLEDKEAGEMLQETVKAMDSDNNILKFVAKRQNPDAVRSRMYFFLAEACRREKDNAKALDYLEKALARDSSDADVLIAMYRMPLPPDRKKKLMENIHEAVDDSRKIIEQHPEDPTAYNQLAWLVANTEGDVDEAIRFSHKSIELKRAGGYLDTLAHCYYAKQDYANAVKYQTEAARLDASSEAITRQLKVFRAALAKQQAEEAAKDGQNPQGDKKPQGDKNEQSGKTSRILATKEPAPS